MKEMINIVGIGLSPEDLSVGVLKKITEADILVGGRRHLAFFSEHKAEKITITKDIEKLCKRLQKKASGKKVVILASGDPNFFGIAAVFCKILGREKIAIMPNITAFQGAFARIKERWDQARFVSLHGRGMDCLDKSRVDAGVLVIYCDRKNSPAKIAQYMISKHENAGEYQTWIFEDLGQSNEKITAGKLKTFQRFASAPLTMMIIKREQILKDRSVAAMLGIPDEEFFHTKGMITRKDVRILALSRFTSAEHKILWDIGAGSGSVSIEAALFCPGMRIYAVEKRKDRFAMLKKNVKKFNVTDVYPILGSAPAVLQGLPAPHAVFIGGSGGQLQRILREVKKRIVNHGCLVVNCVTLQTLTCTTELLKAWQWRYTVTSVNLSMLSSSEVPEIFRPEPQVFIVHGTKA